MNEAKWDPGYGRDVIKLLDRIVGVLEFMGRPSVILRSDPPNAIYHLTRNQAIALIHDVLDKWDACKGHNDENVKEYLDKRPDLRGER